MPFLFLYLFKHVFSEFQQKKKKLSELYLSNGFSENKSNAAQNLASFVNSLTNLLNPDSNFVPQEHIKALKVLRTPRFYMLHEIPSADLSLLGCSLVVWFISWFFQFLSNVPLGRNSYASSSLEGNSLFFTL